MSDEPSNPRETARPGPGSRQRDQDCARVEALCSPYLDGELSTVERQQIDEHMDGCNACRAHRQSLAELESFVERVAPVPLPVGFEERILVAANQLASSRKLARRRTTWMPRMAAAVLGAFAFGAVWQVEAPVVGSDRPVELSLLSTIRQQSLTEPVAWDEQIHRLEALPESRLLNLLRKQGRCP